MRMSAWVSEHRAMGRLKPDSYSPGRDVDSLVKIDLLIAILLRGEDSANALVDYRVPQLQASVRLRSRS